LITREMVDGNREILELEEECVSSEEQLEKEETVFRSWSLSSNSIITAWEELAESSHSSAALEANTDLPGKAIQSYTSDSAGMFSPLYEVTMEQQNVFQASLRPLPKPGNTPKYGALSYRRPETGKKQFGHNSSQIQVHRGAPPNCSTSCTKKRALLRSASVASLENLPAIKGLSIDSFDSIDDECPSTVKVNNTSAVRTERSAATNSILDVLESSRRDAPKDTAIDVLTNAEQIAKQCTVAQQSPIRNDDPAGPYQFMQLHPNWTLETILSASSGGELSLEPLLSPHSRSDSVADPTDVQSHEVSPRLTICLSSDESVTIHMDDEAQEIETTMEDIPLSPSYSNAVDSTSTDMIQKEVTSQRKIPMGPLPQIFLNQLLQKSLPLMRNMALDTPIMTPLMECALGGFNFEDALPDSLQSHFSVLLQPKTSAKSEGEEKTQWSLSQGKTITLFFEGKSMESASTGISGCLTLDRKSLRETLSSLKQRRSKQPDDTPCPKDGETVATDQEDATHEEGQEAVLLDIGPKTPGSTVSLLSPGTLSITGWDDRDCAGCGDDLLSDTELRAVMKLTKDGDDLSVIFPKVSHDMTEECDSDDGLDIEVDALPDFQDDLRHTIAVAAGPGSKLAPVTSPLRTPVPATFSPDSSMASFGNVNNVSSNDTVAARATTPFARKVRFNDEVQEFLFVSEVQSVPSRRSSSDNLCAREEGFMDEVSGIFEDMMDELTLVCASAAEAIDGSRVPKAGNNRKIRRSSVSQ
jgi:hypothetical protein